MPEHFGDQDVGHIVMENVNIGIAHPGLRLISHEQYGRGGFIWGYKDDSKCRILRMVRFEKSMKR